MDMSNTSEFRSSVSREFKGIINRWSDNIHYVV